MLSLLDSIAGVAQLGDTLLAGAAPWRFLFSSRYRGQVLEGWRNGPRHVAAVQQILGVLVAVVEIVVLMLLVDAIRRT